MVDEAACLFVIHSRGIASRGEYRMLNAQPICTSVVGLTLAALLTVGCGASPPTDPIESALAAGPPVSANRGQPDKQLPFRLRGDAVFLAQDLAPGFGPPQFGKSDFGGRCSVPSDFVLQFALEGQATHLGRFTGVAEHCSQIDFATGLSLISDGVLMLTAANGDELWTGYFRNTLGEGQPEEHEFIGGTGQFVGASGAGLGHPVCDRAAGTCTFELEGVIVYDASDRS